MQDNTTLSLCCQVKYAETAVVTHVRLPYDPRMACIAQAASALPAYSERAVYMHHVCHSSCRQIRSLHRVLLVDVGSEHRVGQQCMLPALLFCVHLQLWS